MNPLNSISGYIESFNGRRIEGIVRAIRRTRGELRDLLTIDAQHQHGQEVPQLGQALGPLGRDALDLGSLATVLQHRRPATVLPGDQRRRIEELIQNLETMEETWKGLSIAPRAMPPGEAVEAVVAWAETHFNRLAGLCALLRQANLELGSRYEPARHTPFFASFGWSQLSAAELSLGPAIVVRVDLAAMPERLSSPLAALLENGLPLKVLGLRASVPAVASPNGFSWALLPLALRAVYLLQTPTSAGDFESRLNAALASPRAALVSGLTAAGEVAAESLRSRAFPALVYDPDRAEGLVGCFDLSGNPDPAAPLGGGERADEGAARGALWTTLQELAGLRGPHLVAQAEALRASFEAEQQKREKKLREEIEATCREAEEARLAASVRALVADWTGADPGGVATVAGPIQ